MKKRFILGALAAAGIVAYLLSGNKSANTKRRKKAENGESFKPSHHRTNVFAKAKLHAVNK